MTGEPESGVTVRQDPRVVEYLDHLRAERGLSENTLAAYRSDIAKLTAWAGKGQLALESIGPRDISAFLAHLKETGLSARSMGRAIHGIRGLFKFLVREEKLRDDPMENIRSPRPFKPLP